MLQLLVEQMNLNFYQYIFTSLNNLNESFCFVGNFHNATETKSLNNQWADIAMFQMSVVRELKTTSQELRLVFWIYLLV